MKQGVLYSRSLMIRLSVVIAVCFLIACATVPITGRLQFRLISNDDLLPAVNQEYDRLMSFLVQRGLVLTAADSPEAGPIIRFVNVVTDRIVEAAGVQHKYEWRTTIIKAKEANAAVLPNGRILVFGGLLPIAKNEAGLAAVIGHEVGHLVAQHRAERVSQALAGEVALEVLNLALEKSRYRPVIAAAVGLGLQYGVLLPFSREHELEADHLGLLFMAKAGYDPTEAAEMFNRMEAAHGMGAWEFLSSHPNPSSRHAEMLRWLPEAQILYANPDQPLPSGAAELDRLRQERLRQQAVAPVAPRPSFLPGYWWRTKVTTRSTPVTYRYVQEEQCSENPGVRNTCFVVESETQRLLLTKDYAILDGRSKENKPGGRYSPAMKMLDWPLYLGKKWSQEIIGDFDSGKRGKIKTDVEVVAYEPVTVPAGTFMAYKIVLSFNGTRSLEYWYAPEVRNIVRSALRAVFGLTFTAEEMTDYQKAVEPVIEADWSQ